MGLEALIFWGMMELAPYREAAWLEARAVDIALGAQMGTSPFEGEAAVEAGALALVAIGDHEGDGFDPRVNDCRRTSDGGKTVSLFGLMEGASWQDARRTDICTNTALAAWLSQGALRFHATRCTRSGPIGWFYGYASGSCAKKSDAGMRLCRRWERLARRAGLDGAVCDQRRRLIGFARPPAESSHQTAGLPRAVFASP